VFLDRVVTKAGWPTPSVCGHWQWDGRNPSGEEDRFVGALAVPEWAKPNEGARRLIDFVPYGPLWPGFAINTVFYGVIVWLLFAGPFVVRRWRRIRRGLCPKCAYDLRGRPPKDAEKCPECGSIVAS